MEFGTLSIGDRFAYHGQEWEKIAENEAATVPNDCQSRRTRKFDSDIVASKTPT